jgi:hypothetical protein
VGLHPDEFLLAKTEAELTPFQLAAQENHVGILQKLWVWAKEGQLNSNELKKNLLLVEDNDGFTACHHAKLNGILEALLTLLIWKLGLVVNTLELLLV